MKKVISYILVFIICLQVLPHQSFSAPVSKKIDVILNGIDLKVNGNKISHKSAFIYDNEIYIPLMDLAKALDLKTSLKEQKTLYINSNQKLNLTDNSSAYVAYQRGYEINAKNRLIQEIENKIEGKTPQNSNKREKNSINVGFGNINLYLDNKKLDLYLEPFLYNNDIYVEVGSISRDLFITPNIVGSTINFDTNAVLKQENSNINTIQLAANREIENNRLTRLLEEMNKKKKIILDLKLPYMEVKNTSDMERYLNKYFDKIEINKDNYVEFDIELRKNSNSSYYLEIDIANRYRNNWRKLNKGQVQGYIWDLYVAITNLLDNDAKVQGAIRNPGSFRRNYVTFDTSYKDLNFNFTDSGLDLTQKIDINFIKDLLEDNRSSVYEKNKFNFEVRISGYDIEILIEDINDLYFDKWNLYRRTRFLDSIGRTIQRYYPDLRIIGKVFNKEQSSNFVIDKDIHSSDIILELTERINKDYSLVIENGVRINISYTITEENNEITLMAYTDISISSERWNERVLSAINNEVNSALKEILSVFSKDITVKIFDKDGQLINDYGIFENTVASVTANPKGGEVLSSEKIQLSTDTEGATIYYTTDNTNPTINSTKYTGEITIGQDTVIKAFAVKSGMKDSSISTFTFKVISDENMSRGLDDLEIRPDGLRPSFTRLNKTYTLNVGGHINTISLRPMAEIGTIEIDGVEVQSGQTETMDIGQGGKVITITHKEENKKEITYTITVTKSTTNSDVLLEVESFVSSIVGKFKGYLISRDIEDFTGYTVKLMTKAGVTLKESDTNSRGEFSIDFEPNIFNTLVGYKYEVLDPNGNKVDEGNL